MSSKLRIKIGEVEIDYDGTEEFLKQELPQLLKTAMELHRASEASGSGQIERRSARDDKDESSRVSLTTNSIAARLSAKTGGDLLLAAAAHLVLAKGVEPFTRTQLLDTMKSATSYYNKNYSTNLSGYIKTALHKDGPLAETAKHTYALTAPARAELEKTLADS